MNQDDLDPSGRIVVETIYELFRARGAWPTFAVVDRRLDRRHGLDAQAQLAGLPRRYFRRSRLNGPFLTQDEVRLTLTGVAECPESNDDLERLVQLVLWLADRERHHDPEETGEPMVVTSDEAVAGLQLASDEEARSAIQRLWGLLELLPSFWAARSWTAEPLRWEITVTRAVRTYRDLRGHQDLVERVEAFWTRADEPFSLPPPVVPTTATRASIPATAGRKPGMVRPEAIDEFSDMATTQAPDHQIVEGLRGADERTQLEPALMRIIGEVDETPHGPTEIADLTTAHLRVLGRAAFAGVVIKGRGSKKVRAAEVADQLQRAAALPSVGLVVLAAVGDIQDDTKHRIAWLADKAKVDWLILDRGDLARLFVAYGELCPNDGSWLGREACPNCGWAHQGVQRKRDTGFTVLTLEDTSHRGAKRFAAHILVPPGLVNVEIESRIRDAVPRLRAEQYSRSEEVEAVHGHRLADVLFLFVYQDVTDRPYANWICRALWVSPDLAARSRPATWGNLDATDPALRIDWNSNYDLIASMLADRLDKGTYLRDVDRYLIAAADLVEKARPFLESASLDPDAERVLKDLSARIDTLVGPDRSRAAPHECADLDNMFEGVTGDLINLTLPFTIQGGQTWPDPVNRLRMGRDALSRYDLDRATLQFERQKIK